MILGKHGKDATETYKSCGKPQHRCTCYLPMKLMLITLEGREVLLHSLTCLCSPLLCFSMSGIWVHSQDVFCDTLTVDASAALGGDQLSWTHSQMPSSLKTQAAAHRNLLFSFSQAAASKALLKVGENNAWWWCVSHPTARTAVPQPSSSCLCLLQAGLPALTYMVHRGNAAVSPCATLRHLCHCFKWPVYVLDKKRISTEQPPHPGTCTWCLKMGTAGICSSLFFSINCLR